MIALGWIDKDGGPSELPVILKLQVSALLLWCATNPDLKDIAEFFVRIAILLVEKVISINLCKGTSVLLTGQLTLKKHKNFGK